MSRYTKRPVTIDAMQHDGTERSATAIAAWIDSFGGIVEVVDAEPDEENFVLIGKPRRTMLACTSDWVIREVEGDFRLCTNSIFEKTYEPEVAE